MRVSTSPRQGMNSSWNSWSRRLSGKLPSSFWTSSVQPGVGQRRKEGRSEEGETGEWAEGVRRGEEGADWVRGSRRAEAAAAARRWVSDSGELTDAERLVNLVSFTEGVTVTKDVNWVCLKRLSLLARLVMSSLTVESAPVRTFDLGKGRLKSGSLENIDTRWQKVSLQGSTYELPTAVVCLAVHQCNLTPQLWADKLEQTVSHTKHVYSVWRLRANWSNWLWYYAQSAPWQLVQLWLKMNVFCTISV